MGCEPVNRAWDSDHDIVRRVRSPAFKLPPLDLVGGELMPPDVREVCDWVWGACSFAARDIPVRRYSDVFVVYQGLVVRPIDRAAYRASISQHTEYDLKTGLSQIENAERLGNLPNIKGPCILCTKPGGDNYGHWINEMLPRADIGRRLGLSDVKYLVPRADPPLNAVIQDSLELIGIPRQAVLPVDGPVRVDELYGISGITDHGVFMSPQILRCLYRIQSKLEPDPPSRIYVTRRGRTRKFKDETAVCEIFRRHGYRVVDPSLLDFRSQVRAFMGAEEVVGCMGAGLTNIGFAPSRIPVTTFAPAEMADTFYYFLAGLKRQAYKEVRCAVTQAPQGVGLRDHDLLLEADEVFALAQRS